MHDTPTISDTNLEQAKRILLQALAAYKGPRPP